MDCIKYARGGVWMYKPYSEAKPTPGVQAGERPIVIISNDKFNFHSGVVNCISVTTESKYSPVHVNVSLDEQSQVLCEQIKTVSQKQLTTYMGQLHSQKMAEIEKAILFQFGINAPDSNQENIQENQIEPTISTQAACKESKAKRGMTADEVRKMYIDDDITAKDCAEHFGVSPAAFYAFLKAHEISKKKSKPMKFENMPKGQRMTREQFVTAAKADLGLE